MRDPSRPWTCHNLFFRSTIGKKRMGERATYNTLICAPTASQERGVIVAKTAQAYPRVVPSPLGGVVIQLTEIVGLVCHTANRSMASNGKSQFIRNVFSQQSNGAVVERLQRFGPRHKAMQSRVMSKPAERSKKHGSSRRKTVHLVLWVNPIVKAELQRLADREGISMSSDYSESTCFRLLGTRTPQQVTLPPDGSVRAGEFLTQPHDPGELTTGSWGTDATCPSVSWEHARRTYIAGLYRWGLP
jgi:hypothetical protein